MDYIEVGYFQTQVCLRFPQAVIVNGEQVSSYIIITLVLFLL